MADLADDDTGPKGRGRDKEPSGRVDVDLVYRFSIVPGDGPDPRRQPETFEEVVKALKDGNDKYAEFVRLSKDRYKKVQQGKPARSVQLPPVELEPEEVGLGPDGDKPRPPDGFPAQRPFAVVLGCADARVPAEILFAKGFDDLFNIRVAGNVLGLECVGSVRYALHAFGSPKEGNAKPAPLQAAIVLGHRDCGAVKATVETYFHNLIAEPSPGLDLPDSAVGAILRRINFPALTVALEAFPDTGKYDRNPAKPVRYRAFLTDLVVHLNAAWAAHELQLAVQSEQGGGSGKVPVVYGIFDPGDCRVRADVNQYRRSASVKETFAPPPADLKELRALARKLARAIDQAHENHPEELLGRFNLLA